MLLTAAQGARGIVVDLDTGRRVPKVISLDTEAGLVTAYRTDSAGDDVLDPVTRQPQTFVARGRFKLLSMQEARAQGLLPGPPTMKLLGGNGSNVVRKLKLGAPNCARCNSVLTLPGDDLCAICKAADRGKPFRLLSHLSVTKCQMCSRQAVWCTGDEVEASPERRGRRLYGRGQLVGRRYYCERHFQAPRVVDAAGEIVQKLEGEARPK